MQKSHEPCQVFVGLVEKRAEKDSGIEGRSTVPSIGQDMDYPSEGHAQMAFSVDSSHQAFQLSQEVHLFIFLVGFQRGGVVNHNFQDLCRTILNVLVRAQCFGVVNIPS